MRQFVAGFVLGVVIALAVGANAAIIAGEDGHALGWSVTKDGEEICSSPFVWVDLEQIECD